MELLRVKKLTEFAIIPTRGSKFAAGFDLSSAYDTVVPKRGKAIVKTDLSIAIPPETYARIGKAIYFLDSMSYGIFSSKKWTGSEEFYRCWCWSCRLRLSRKCWSCLVQS